MTFAKVGGSVLLAIACLLWLGLVAAVLTLNSSDPAGNALSYSFAMLMTIALWILLAILLLLAGAKGAMPRSVALWALVLVPLSGAAAVASLVLLEGRVDTLAKWPLAVPVLAPLLIMLYAAWSLYPAWRATVPPNAANAAVWGGLLILSLVPWPAVLRSPAERAKAQEAFEAQEERAAALKREENLAKFRQLTSESALWDWLQFTTDGNELRDSAFAGIQRLQRRQADAEELIMRGEDLPMMELRHLDLSVTPRFCGIAVEFLRKDAESFRPTTTDPKPLAVMPYQIDRHLTTMHWLEAHGCDCDVAVKAYATTAGLYPASPERARFIAQLAELRKPNASAP
ncbi:MAG: hypothetical protein ACREOG_15100 [Gemmatimonadaceae bacterium]